MFGENAFLTKNHKFLEFLKTSNLSIGYQAFQKIKRLCNKLTLKTRVKVEGTHYTHPLCFLIR